MRQIVSIWVLNRDECLFQTKLLKSFQKEHYHPCWPRRICFSISEFWHVYQNFLFSSIIQLYDNYPSFSSGSKKLRPMLYRILLAVAKKCECSCFQHLNWKENKCQKKTKKKNKKQKKSYLTVLPFNMESHNNDGGSFDNSIESPANKSW